MWHLRTQCSIRWILLQKSWNWSPLPLFSNQAVAYQPEALEALWHWRYISQNRRGINYSLVPKKERKQEVGNPHLNKCCGKATSSPITRLSQTITPNPFSVATLTRARVRNFGGVCGTPSGGPVYYHPLAIIASYLSPPPSPRQTLSHIHLISNTSPPTSSNGQQIYIPEGILFRKLSAPVPWSRDAYC